MSLALGVATLALGLIWIGVPAMAALRARRREEYLAALGRWPHWDWRSEAKAFDAVVGVRVRWYGPIGSVYITWGRNERHAHRRIRAEIGSWTRHLEATRDLA